MNVTVTAVGRRLRPRNGEPQRHHVIAVREDHSSRGLNGWYVRTVIDRLLKPET